MRSKKLPQVAPAHVFSAKWDARSERYIALDHANIPIGSYGTRNQAVVAVIEAAEIAAKTSSCRVKVRIEQDNGLWRTEHVGERRGV
jgi:hypothetical protein